MASWLPIGLWVGDFDYVLSRVSRDTFERRLYQWLFYGGMVLVAVDAWSRSRPPRPGWGTAKLFALYFVQGLLASAVLRFLLISLGAASWTLSNASGFFLLQALLSCFVVALVEESLFRGFLLGHLVAKLGWRRGVLLTSLLFAAVHLFRPGGWEFKLSYGLGLFLLAYLLACIAWRHDSILASAGFHGGVILLNLTLTLSKFEPSLLAGSQSEPVSGAVSIGLTAAYLSTWLWVTRRRERSGRELHGSSADDTP